MNIFEAIKNDDLEQVKALVEADPACVNAIAPKKPADTKGMSPLQVAVTTGWHRKIAWYLLEHGADVNFIEPIELQRYQADPVLFDVAQVAVRNARRLERDPATGEYRMMHTKEDADEAFAFLEAVVEHGADTKMTDYYDNGVMSRVLFAADNVYPDPEYTAYKHTDEQDEDLLRIFRFLLDSGAEKETVSKVSKTNNTGMYQGKPIWQLVGGLFGADGRGDSLCAVLAEYPRSVVEYSIVAGSPSSCRGCEAHRAALKQAFRKFAEDDGETSYDVIAARGKQIDAAKLFAPACEAEALNYRGAFLHPPHGVKYTDADFDRVNAALFPNGADKLEVYEWTTDWSNYFDDGHEWWGALCLTVYDKSTGRFVVILASATD